MSGPGKDRIATVPGIYRKQAQYRRPEDALYGRARAMVLACICHTLILVSAAAAFSPAIGASSPSSAEDPFFNDIAVHQWGGHVKMQTEASWPGDRSLYQAVDPGPYVDEHFDLRLKHTLFFSDRISFETHYEGVCSAGDTREVMEERHRNFMGDPPQGLMIATEMNDDGRFMNLTDTIKETENSRLYHRLDRLVLTLQPRWGVVRIGRQALTWGNGLLFNPMDIFNPFSPTDFERDYKVGDDMIFVQLPVYDDNDAQLLFIPRRSEKTGDLQWRQSALAGKYHLFFGTAEFDIMAAKNYEDVVFGLGARGYIRDAAWRMDALWTFLDGQIRKEDTLSYVTNIDYSWTWWGKNLYGLAEFYVNGLGHSDASRAYADPFLIERIGRGEIFALGKYYANGEIQAELHPLVKIYAIAIYNVEDHSGILQPRTSWDIAENAQLIVGANVTFGKTNTEFGGFPFADTDYVTTSPDSAFLWLSVFF